MPLQGDVYPTPYNRRQNGASTPWDYSMACECRPPLVRLQSVLEVPVGCMRRCNKCFITANGCQVNSSPTTHVEAPRTVLKKGRGLLRNPRRFRNMIMEPDVDLGMFPRRDLLEIMNLCFESPFGESAPDPRDAVCVEMAHRRGSATASLRRLSHDSQAAP